MSTKVFFNCEMQRLFNVRRFFLNGQIFFSKKNFLSSLLLAVCLIFSFTSHAELVVEKNNQPVVVEKQQKQQSADVTSQSDSVLNTTTKSSGSNLVSVVELLGSLLVVIALILFLGWALKRMGMAGPANGTLKVVSSLPLGNKQQLMVVQAGQQQLLVGVSPGAINLIKEFDQPIVDLAITQNAVEKTEATAKLSNKFSLQLARALGKSNG